MNLLKIRELALLLGLLCGLPNLVNAAEVKALFDLSNPATSPFPSNRFTAVDFRQLTNLRVNLPKPNCAVQVSDCQDIDVINTLDGFNVQPRLSIPFSGAIDPTSVNSSNVFLVSLGDTTQLFKDFGTVVGINQIVWDPATLTLFAEADQLLRQHTIYLLVVTDGIRDSSGKRIKAGHFVESLLKTRVERGFDFGLHAYRQSLLVALAAARIPKHRIVTASLFTTQSVTADLEKVRRQIKSHVPTAANFTLSNDISRTVFSIASITNMTFANQIATTPSYDIQTVPIAALGVIPNAVDSIAFGSYSSPDYETAEQIIPTIHTRTGKPVVQRYQKIYFNLFLPAGRKPANGWPVAIFGHGFGASKQNAPFTVAATMAARGIATIAINTVGHGGGALGTLTIDRAGLQPVTLPAGGRGIDQNNDGAIDSTEGVSAIGPRNIISSRDGLRQTVIDLMQLVRVIETGGMDVNGDGSYDLDGERIYYFGQSFGGMYGTILLGVEPSIDAGVNNVGGGPFIDIARLGQFRPLVGQGLAMRVPALLNALPFAPPLYGFNENMPLRNQPPLINTVAGAVAIQTFIDRSEWVSQSGDAVTYAPHLRKDPLPGMQPKPVIIQIAKGDQVAPNPTNFNIVRAGALEDRTTFYRNDLAFAANPATPKDPHAFLTAIGSPLTAPIAVAAQMQIATFFGSNGTVTIDPDGPGILFETPIALPLPEGLNFIP